ncbi:MAG TPA: excinuclease ABC subunit UvrA [Chitinophagaceae bacterium]|nr:excinuclease ABC subunit UvrA [Chitinophagaceae bacterium]
MAKQDLDIKVKGARVHNLKNIDVVFPHNKLIVVTGVSGSGKSSLTMDTLFAEGQRRYVESLSSYARQFMRSMQKPDVDLIEGLCPAIAIEQKVISRTPRSTVGSMTEIIDYMRLLFAKAGRTFSPVSGREVKKDEISDVIQYIQQLPKGTRIQVIVPLPENAKKSLTYYLEDILHKGYSRIYLPTKKETLPIEDILAEGSTLNVDEAYLLIDRIVVKAFEQDELHRLADSLQTAFDETNGDLFIEIDQQRIEHFCNRFELDGMRFEEPSPNFFSSNNPYGACPDCEGFGMVLGIDPNLVIPNKNLSVHEGAVVCWNGDKMSEWKKQFIYDSKSNFPVHKPIRELSKEQYDLLWKSPHGIDAFFKMVSENLYKVQYRVLQARYRGKTKCASCEGSRIRKDALYVKINNTSIAELLDLPVEKVMEWMRNLTLNDHDKVVSKRILTELEARLQTLLDVGLNYLTLNRTANTLSGGESQRIQLTRVIGSNLSDSLYILDEPSIGLHARDTHRLIGVLKKLRDLGNTVIVVEHDDQIMRDADYIIDIGPFASHLGGEVIAHGNYKELIKNKKSLTARYLNGELKTGIEKHARKVINKITLSHCTLHNLKDVQVTFPLNMLCVVTGVSGSGKTSLVKHILYPAMKNHLGDFTVKPGDHEALTGDVSAIKAIEMVDQNPIGKSSRSNPVTYIKAYDEIRTLYAAQHLSKVRGYSPGYFSFNVEGGRCDHCKGEGEIIVEMQFLADVHLTCESCKGKRFKPEVLEVLYQGKSITDVLDMSVDEAIEFFSKDRKIHDKLNCLAQVGLGYIKLGQSSDTLSGGEAQRVKLASFLDKSFANKKILFIFDEPTTGLHFHDIHKLLQSFEALIEQGHSIIVIEHNPDIIRNADWIIDLGPEGGEGGGHVLFEGTYAALKTSKSGYTAQFI